VTSDDYGLLKLFNYPVVIQDAPHRAYRGHSSHVMCVRFNADDSLVCSTGGKDWAMFQFRVVPVDVADDGGPEATGRPAGVAGGAGTAGGATSNMGVAAAKGRHAGQSDMVWGPLDAAGKLCLIVRLPITQGEGLRVHLSTSE
jgi:microtubule-associated protein-like 6